MKARNIVLAALLVSISVSCVYDFNPRIEGEGGHLVVEGNIVLGTLCNIRCTMSTPLEDESYTYPYPIPIWHGEYPYESGNTGVKMHIEDSKGNSYQEIPSWGWSGYTTFDLRDADYSLEYRLVLESGDDTYASSWAKAGTSSGIDSVSYVINDDKTSMDIQISTHSDDPSAGYYQWEVTETWEYTAEIYAIYKAEVKPDYNVDLVLFEGTENTYYCWNSDRRTELMTYSTEGLTENRIVNHTLYSIANTDKRISNMYRIDVNQYFISEEAHRYYEMMQRNNSNVGGLFSPEPSECRGNIVNIADTSELVLGYVDVTAVTTARCYIDNSKLRFYKGTRVLDEPELLRTQDEWNYAYLFRDMRPEKDEYDEFTGSFLGYSWWPARCVDCRYGGGYKSRPDDWPTNHY